MKESVITIPCAKGTGSVKIRVFGDCNYESVEDFLNDIKQHSTPFLKDVTHALSKKHRECKFGRTSPFEKQGLEHHCPTRCAIRQSLIVLGEIIS